MKKMFPILLSSFTGVLFMSCKDDFNDAQQSLIEKNHMEEEGHGLLPDLQTVVPLHLQI